MWEKFVARAKNAWEHAVRVGRVLHACRVSAGSALLGVFLFWSAAPAQNIFADTAWNANLFGAIGYWGAVFAALFVVWAFPVHFGARWTLEDNAWLVPASLRRKIEREQGTDALNRLYESLRAEHEQAIAWVPRALGVLPFVAFAVGIGFELATHWAADGLNQGRETLTQLKILLAVDVVVALLFVLFVIKRKDLVESLSSRMQNMRGATYALEKLVWISLFATFAIFVISYHFPFIPSTILPRALMIPFLFGSLMLILSWMQRCVHRDGVPYITLAVFGCLLLTGLNAHFNDLRTVPMATDAVAQRQIAVSTAIERWKLANDCSDKPCPPALVVAIDGGASRAAFAAATFIGELLDRMPPAQGHLRPDPARRIFAISGVSGGSVGAVTIRTALADAMSDPHGAPPCRNADRTWFHAEQFGRADRAFTWRECLQALVTGDYLSPVFVGLGFRDNFAPARYLVAGPSLLDDRAALLERAFEHHYENVLGDAAKRAALGPSGKNEPGVRRRFGYLPLTYKADGDDKSWLPLLLLNVTSVQSGRRIVISDLSSTYLDKTHNPVGLYTEAYDFFEMLSSPCATPNFEASDCRSGPIAAAQRLSLDAPDVLLSTAAVASARFPIISPAGAVTVEGAPAFGDRLVDGGYFENSGDTTALDIANALLAHGLDPVILSIANDPERPSVDVSVPRRPVVTPVVGVSRNDLRARILGIVSAPFETLLNTRDGHGAEAKDLVVRTFAECRPTSCKASAFYKLGVAAHPDLAEDPNATPYDKEHCKDIWTDAKVDLTQIALSWWLSGSLQAELDVQRCTKENRDTLRDLIALLSPG